MDFQGYLLNLKLNLDEARLNRGYPFDIPTIKTLKELRFHPKVTFLIGDNGTGKSTLLEAIAIYLGFNPEGGSKNFNFKTKESHSALHNSIQITKGYKQMKDGFFLRSESFYNVASEIDSIGGPILKAYGGISLHEQSHGESFWSLLINRFKGNGLYILDEPESALSITRQMATLKLIDELTNKNSQFIIATHSPILLAYPDALIYEFTKAGIKEIKYTDTETYKVTKEFLNNPQKMIDILLK